MSMSTSLRRDRFEAKHRQDSGSRISHSRCSASDGGAQMLDINVPHDRSADAFVARRQLPSPPHSKADRGLQRD